MLPKLPLLSALFLAAGTLVPLSSSAATLSPARSVTVPGIEGPLTEKAQFEYDRYFDRCRWVRRRCAERWGWGTWEFRRCVARRGCGYYRRWY